MREERCEERVAWDNHGRIMCTLGTESGPPRAGAIGWVGRFVEREE